MTFLISSLGSAARRLRGSRHPACLACGQAVRPGRRRIEVRGSAVHRECATYRLRNPGAAPDRLGYPR